MKIIRNICKEACVLLITLIMVFSTVTVTANSVNNSKLSVLLEENFEDGIIPPTGWTVNGDEWSISTDAAYGNYSAKFSDPTSLKTSELIAPVLEFEDVEKVNISFWFKNPDGLDNLTVFVSWGGPWYQLGDSYTEPVEQYTKVNLINEVIFGILMIKFTVVSGGGEGVYLDYIKVSDKESNYPPFAPTIKGENNGKPGREYEYKFKTTDPEGDKITYRINWGDGTQEIDIGPFQSGYELSAKHIYSNKGTYTIKAKAFDEKYEISDETTFTVSISKSKSVNTPLLIQKLFQRFTFFEKILNQILQTK